MSKSLDAKVMRVLYVVLFTLASLFLVTPFIIPIIFAGTLALALYPLLLKLEIKGLSRSRAAMLLTTVFTFMISIPFLFFSVKGTIAVINALEKFETMKDQNVESILNTLRSSMMNAIQKYLSQYEFADFLTPQKIEMYMKTVNVYVLNFFQNFAASIPTLILFLIIMILCIYSFLCYADGVRKFFQYIFSFSDETMNEIVKIYVRDSRMVYVSNITTGGIQSLIVSISVALMGLGDFFLVFFVTLILSFIPVIGAGPVAVVFAIYAFFKGSTGLAIALVVIAIFTGAIDNILRPYLASFGDSKIPAIMSFICVLGGALLLGFPGLFIGLLVGSIAYDTLPIFWHALKGEKVGIEK